MKTLTSMINIDYFVYHSSVFKAGNEGYGCELTYNTDNVSEDYIIWVAELYENS